MTKKLNGMNMQITYCSKLQKFLICTKNNCLLITGLNDPDFKLDYFSEHNYSIA